MVASPTRSYLRPVAPVGLEVLVTSPAVLYPVDEVPVSEIATVVCKKWNACTMLGRLKHVEATELAQRKRPKRNGIDGGPLLHDAYFFKNSKMDFPKARSLW